MGHGGMGMGRNRLFCYHGSSYSYFQRGLPLFSLLRFIASESSHIFSGVSY